MTNSNERRAPVRTNTPVTSTHPLDGEHSIQPEALTPDARDLIAHAEKLVYLFPEGFDPARLVERFFHDAPAIGLEAHVIPDTLVPHTFLGHSGTVGFAIEVRPRSATIIADPFDLRRDLLLLVKGLVAQARAEAAPAKGRVAGAA